MNSFETRDGLIFIGIGNDGTFRKLCQEVGKPELGTDPRFARNQDRIANREAMRAEMEEVFKNFDREPLCDRLLAAGLPAGPIQSIDKALNSEHSKHRGIVVQKDWYKGVASPIRFDRSKASLRQPRRPSASMRPKSWPRPGLKQAEIDELVAAGIVSAAKGYAEAALSDKRRHALHCTRAAACASGIAKHGLRLIGASLPVPSRRTIGAIKTVIAPPLEPAAAKFGR